MALFHDSAIAGASGNQGGGVGYQISRSLRFNSSDSAYLSRTPASAGNRKTWTWAGWVKRSGFANNKHTMFAAGTSNDCGIHFGTGDAIRVWNYSGSYTLQKVTTAVFRDPSAWYHIVVAVDTTDATAEDRCKVYVNGVRQTSFSTNTIPSQNADLEINTTVAHGVGYSASYGYLDGYLADIHFIDGQALTPSSFTEVSATTGQLIPKAYTGTFTGNSFWLKFADNSAATATTLGKDSSGLGNNWTPNNLSVTAGAGNDSLVDTPSSAGTDTGLGGEVTGNYCTLNPLNRNSNANLSNGNLNFSLASAGVNYGTFATFGVRTGKWYFEASIDSFISYGITTGFVTSDWGRDYIGSGGTAYFGLDTTQGRRSSAGITSSGSTVTYGAGDVVGVAFNADAGTATIYKNGASVYTFSGIPANDYFPALSSGGSSAWINFGQRPFAYTAPSGFKALCDTNLPAPVVAKPSTVMDVKLYTGNGSTQTISGLGFSPDLVWIKNRNTAYDHELYDTVRGVTNRLMSSFTGAEDVRSGVTAFNSDGFSLGSAIGANASSSPNVAWCFDAGANTVTNTQGSITSQVRANASAGFSIVTYTGNGTGGATVGHGGLVNLANGMIIVKRRDSAVNWFVGHGSQGWTKVFEGLNTTNAISTTSAAWNNTSPTSTVFTLGTETSMNGNGGTFVAYCFAPVAGYSSLGSYTGNGSTDGPFVFTGMRPRWILIKASSLSATDWCIFDSARDGFNANNDGLLANSSAAENFSVLSTDLDIVSNGFKPRFARDMLNQSGVTYIYAAFAESPFQYARAR